MVSGRYLAFDNEGVPLHGPINDRGEAEGYNIIPINEITGISFDEEGKIVRISKNERSGAVVPLWSRYKEGGLVNYTGPAWVDGTPSTPEAFLSADDTRNFQELAKILQSVLNFDKAPVATTEKDKIQIKSGDTNIEIHIEVDKIDSEESMEELCEMMADKIQQSYSGGISQP
jgi:hypothetical protein